MRLLKTICTLTALVLVAACSTTPSKQAPQVASVKSQEALAKAKQELESGKSPKAQKVLRQIIEENPRSKAAIDAQTILADQLYREKQYGSAYNHYASILNLNVSFDSEKEVVLRAADCAALSGQKDSALKLLNRSLTSNLTPAQTHFALQKRADLLMEKGDSLAALEDYVAINEQAKALDIAETKLSDEQLEAVASQKKYGFLRPQSLFRLGTSNYEKGEYRKARGYFSDLIGIAPDSALAERSNQLIQQIDARSRVDSKTIGVILPLTGKNARLGQKTLRGVQLGLGIYGSQPSGLRLSVIDSEENPEVARRAVEKLVLEDNVITIIGSLLSKEASAVAAKAQELGVPNIALSQKSGVTKIGDFVFRNSITSEMQIRQLVETAMTKFSMKRFAILFPNDAYGIEYANIFWEEVTKRGGEVRAAQSYESNETDFRIPIRKLVGTYYVEDRSQEYKAAFKEWQQKNGGRNRETPKDLIKPILDFDAIFIPDSAKAAGQIAPMLAYNDVAEMRLLGTNLWNTPSLVQRGGKFVEKALFVDGYLPSAEKALASNFMQEFQTTFGSAPDLFEIQAYDSALILRKLISAGATSRISLREKLSQLKDFPGSIHQMSVSPEREIQRPITAFNINAGNIEPIP